LRTRLHRVYSYKEGMFVVKESILTVMALALLIVVTKSNNVSAQLLLDQTLSNSVGMGTELGSAAQGPLSADAVSRRLQQQGYSNVSVSPTNPQRYTAISPAGIPVILTVEPRTGQVLLASPQ